MMGDPVRASITLTNFAYTAGVFIALLPTGGKALHERHKGLSPMPWLLS
jgi:hypothetical protein